MDQRIRSSLELASILPALLLSWYCQPRMPSVHVPVNISVDAAAAAVTRPTKDKPLLGYVIVIDPGHGGMDPGAHGVFRNKPVYEAPYVMDVARRFVADIHRQGGITLLTRHDPAVMGFDDHPPSSVLPFMRTDVFMADGTRVVAGKYGMERRIAAARMAMRKYPRHHIVFVSIHFDAEPVDSLQGAYVVVPTGTRPKVATEIIASFGTAGRLRKRREGTEWRHYSPIVSGGLRHLYILRDDKNPVRERVLVELGNFGNKADVWRIRDPQVRSSYARSMTEALVSLNE